MQIAAVFTALAFACNSVLSVPQDAAAPAVAPLAQPAATDQTAVIEADVFARRVLATADLVLKRHVDPPTRQAMIAAALKALLKAASQPPTAAISRRVSLARNDEELRQLIEHAWSNARKSTQISDDVLQAAALDGLFSQVPDRPHLIPPKEAKVQEQIRGNRYVGIGIQLGMKPGDSGQVPVILNPFARGPARLAGAKPGDAILEVDGVSTAGKALDQVVNLLRGDEGSQVSIVVLPEGSTERRTLEMTRGVIPFQSFAGFRRTAEDEWEYRTAASEPIAYLQLKSLLPSSLSELRRLAPSFDAQGIRALVLDLRNAGGGLDLQNVLLLADELLEEGPIGRMVDSNGTPRTFHSGPDCLFRRWPIAVLVNQYTFGDAEFLAAALQDNRRAVIVGEPTRGRAFVHSPVELPDSLGTVVLRSGILQRADGRPLQRESAPDQTDDPLVVRPVRTVPDTAPVAPESTRPQAAQPAGPTPPPVQRQTGGQESRGRGDGANPPTDSGDAPGAGGVRPDHAVPMPLDQLQNWMRWRLEQDLPEPPAAGSSRLTIDPQLTKALELLRAALANTTDK